MRMIILQWAEVLSADAFSAFEDYHKLCHLAFEFGTYWQTGLAVADVIPLFLGTAPDLQIADGDLRISSGGETGSNFQGITHNSHSSVAYNTIFLGEFMQPDWDMFHVS